MKPCQYIIADHTLGMSPGKLAAQAAHAAIEGLRLNAKSEWGNPWDASIVNRWYQGGHYAKIVLQSDDLLVAERYLNDRGFKTALIVDEGRTEFDGKLTPTAIGLPVLDRDIPHVSETLSAFKLYTQTAPVAIIELADALSTSQYAEVRRLVEQGEIGMARTAMKQHAQRPPRRIRRGRVLGKVF